MIRINIHKLLKDMRTKSEISIKNVSMSLSEMGYKKVNTQTLYGYENGVSMPNADVFLSMCQIYGCNNPLNFYENTDDTLSDEEQNIINMYRNLNTDGRKNAVQRISELTRLPEWSSKKGISEAYSVNN